MNTPKPVVDLRTHNLHIIAEAQSPLNMWGTGEEFHHSPDPTSPAGRNELVLHYIRSKAPERLADEHELVAA